MTDTHPGSPVDPEFGTDLLTLRENVLPADPNDRKDTGTG